VSVGNDICLYLASLDIGTLGNDLFLGHAPDRSTAISVVETGGQAPYHDYGPEEILDRPSVQVLVRHPAYLTGRATADEIRNLLDGLANWPINDTRYLSITAMNDPAYLGKRATSEGEAHEFSLNFSTVRERRGKTVGLSGAYFGVQEWYTL
jgi:hypothetical protein